MMLQLYMLVMVTTSFSYLSRAQYLGLNDNYYRYSMLTWPQYIIKLKADFAIAGITGRVYLWQRYGGQTAVFGRLSGVQCPANDTRQQQLSGLTPNTCKLGFHVHQTAITVANNCSSTGAHYNPLNETHGSPFSAQRHIGDLGNVHVRDGIAYIKLIGANVPLYGQYSVNGRSLVLHHNRDDLGLGSSPESKLNGNSDGRISCADIVEF